MAGTPDNNSYAVLGPAGAHVGEGNNNLITTTSLNGTTFTTYMDDINVATGAKVGPTFAMPGEIGSVPVEVATTSSPPPPA